MTKILYPQNLPAIDDFVEENIYPAKKESQVRSLIAVGVYVAIMTALICFVAGTYIINHLIDVLVLYGN